MDVREKLVELLNEVQETGVNEIPAGFGCTREYIKNEKVASHLIANGVTVQEWISVKDKRKPNQLQECLCVCQFDDDAKGEWRFYNVLKWHDVPYQDNGVVNRPHFTDEGVQGMVVTHWMPLPKLPQPPKGE